MRDLRALDHDDSHGGGYDRNLEVVHCWYDMAAQQTHVLLD